MADMVEHGGKHWGEAKPMYVPSIDMSTAAWQTWWSMEVSIGGKLNPCMYPLD